MPDIKISQLTAKGTAIASTDLLEISESNGAGGFVTKSVTGANILASKQDTLVSGTTIKTIENQSLLGSGNIDISKSDVGLGSVDNTSDVSKPISTATQNALNNKQNTITNSDSITQGSTNLFLTTAERTKLTNTSGTNTGDQTNITGNAATVTTNANLTGVVTSTGNTTAIANGAISNAMLANGAVANLSGTNTGDNATNSQYSGLVSNATHTGDATGNVGLTVKGINGTLLSSLTTGILKNTTVTGVPSIAVAADFPILNQNTTGTAGSTATLATARTISTNGDVAYTSPPFDGSANVLGTATLAAIGVAGTYTKVTTDAKGRVTVGANITSADVPTLNQNTTGTADNVTGIVAVANGGTGTATPALVAGTNITLTGAFPNQTINATGGGGGVTQLIAGTNITLSPAGGTGVVTVNSSGGGGGGTEIGALIGGGIVVAVFVQGGVNKALVASLTNLSTASPWTIPAFQNSLIGTTAQSPHDGLTNTNAIILQTAASATTLYAAGRARLHNSGGYNDWYLPAIFELNMCYNSAGVTGKVLGANGFLNQVYWSSTESNFGTNVAMFQDFLNESQSNTPKSGNFGVRAVRIHTIL